MKNNDINNLKINNKAFKNKKRYKLYVGILATTLAVTSIFGPGIFKNATNNNIDNNVCHDTDIKITKEFENNYAKINCNFNDYKNINNDENIEHVTFIKDDGEIVGYVDINNKGETCNLTIYLEEGNYYAINSGGEKTMIEFAVEDPNEEYTLNIDCNDNSMEIHKNNTNAKKL
jgi:hypothetical protein